MHDGAADASTVRDTKRAYIVYFVHQEGEEEAKANLGWKQRSVLQIAELKEKDGVVSVDRNAPVRVRLNP